MIEEVFLESRLAALRGVSRLTDEVLALEGMSDPRMRHLLNNIGARVRTYVEVGCYHGSTLIAAAYRNTHLSALGIDNFSEDHPALNRHGGPREQLPRNLHRYAPHAQFFEADFRSVALDESPAIDCFFYDGPHDREPTRDAVTHFAPWFAEEALLLVDDWNWESPRLGTYDGLHDLRDRLQVVCSSALCDTWNNVGVFVLRRVR
jgi:hypothetical protein